MFDEADLAEDVESVDSGNFRSTLTGEDREDDRHEAAHDMRIRFSLEGEERSSASPVAWVTSQTWLAQP